MLKDTNSQAETETVREALASTLAEEMRLNKEIFLMGEEIGEYQGAYKVTQGLLHEFGSDRVIDTPITEHGFAGLAIGAAFAGLRPVVEFMTFNFALQAMDQLVNSAAKTLYMSGGRVSCPIVFRGPNGPASQVGAQHSQDFSSWFAHIPGLKVMQPYTAHDHRELLKAAIRDPNPVIFLENEILYNKSFPVSKQRNENSLSKSLGEVFQVGSDITFVSSGIGMQYAIEASEVLATHHNISVEIINLRSLRPIDKHSIIESVKHTGRCITIEEGWPVCSIGNHISAILMQEAFDFLDAPVLNITSHDVPMPYASNLEKYTLPKVDDIVSGALSICYVS